MALASHAGPICNKRGECVWHDADRFILEASFVPEVASGFMNHRYNGFCDSPYAWIIQYVEDGYNARTRASFGHDHA